MARRTVFTMKLSQEERELLDQLAERRAETRGDVLRGLIRRAAERTQRAPARAQTPTYQTT